MTTSIQDFSTDQFVVTVNAREISDWGDTNPPYAEEPIDPAAVLRRGLGGSAIRLDRINPGIRATLNLNPGSADATYMRGLMTSKANITLTRTQIGTNEIATFTEGVIVNRGNKGRGGTTITDNAYVIEFNDADELE